MAKEHKPKSSSNKKARNAGAHARAQRAVEKHAASETSLQYIPWRSIPLEELNPLLQRQFVVGQEIMLARVLLKKGCIVPEHSHHNEQLTYILDGALKFWIDGQEIVVRAGEVLCIPAHMPHKAEALEDTVDLDVFNPPRADWINKTDQYLRGAEIAGHCMPSSTTPDKDPLLSKSRATFRFRCIGCASLAHAASQDFRCPECGNLLEITDPSWKSPSLSAETLKSIWRERRSSNAALDLSGVWRFRELLPAPESAAHVISLREGNTPLYELPQASRSTGVARLYAKHQGMNPTGSFKDAGMTVAATFAHQAGYKWVACASTGNTSASMAAYAARGGMRSLVLVPEGKISWSKLSQALDYGALTCQLRTDFDGCLRLLQELVRRAPVYQLNSINPFRLEGQKTLALELLEQLDWQPPDHIIVPGGNLGNSSAIGKALLEMLDLGLIPRLPKLFVIQAEGANALVRTLREAAGKHLVAVQPETRATAIRIGNPASWEKAVRVIQATGGACDEVSEIEIAQAKAEIGAEGIGCEPASAVTLAGLKKLLRQGFVKPEESVVLVLTGNLLKDPDFTMEFHRGDLFLGAEYERANAALKPLRHPPVVLDATLDAVIQTLKCAEKSDPASSDA